jgi:hypothetical protein
VTLARSLDWHQPAVAYVRWSLMSSRTLSVYVERTVDLQRGTFIAYAPADVAVSEFRCGARSSVEESVAAMVGVCGEFLSAPGRVAVFEHHLINLADAREYLKGERRLTADSVAQVAFSGATPAELMATIREWNVGPIFNAFLADIGQERAKAVRSAGTDSAIDGEPIVAGLRQVICGAYDGESFLLWQDVQSGAE